METITSPDPCPNKTKVTLPLDLKAQNTGVGFGGRVNRCVWIWPVASIVASRRN